MKNIRFLALMTAVLLLIAPAFALAGKINNETPTYIAPDSGSYGQICIGFWQVGDGGYIFVSNDPGAPTAVCEKVTLQGGTFYYDAATGNYYDSQGHNVTFTINSGESQMQAPSKEGPITLGQTASVAFSNGRSTLGLKTPAAQNYMSPQELMSAMGRIDFLIFIGDTIAREQQQG